MARIESHKIWSMVNLSGIGLSQAPISLPTIKKESGQFQAPLAGSKSFKTTDLKIFKV
jgi:hypothetical protein